MLVVGSSFWMGWMSGWVWFSFQNRTQWEFLVKVFLDNMTWIVSSINFFAFSQNNISETREGFLSRTSDWCHDIPHGQLWIHAVLQQEAMWNQRQSIWQTKTLWCVCTKIASLSSGVPCYLCYFPTRNCEESSGIVNFGVGHERDFPRQALIPDNPKHWIFLIWFSYNWQPAGERGRIRGGGYFFERNSFEFRIHMCRYTNTNSLEDST